MKKELQIKFSETVLFFDEEGTTKLLGFILKFLTNKEELAVLNLRPRERMETPQPTIDS